MKTIRDAYVETFVALRRTKRHLERAESQWRLWLKRSTLAYNLGQEDLAVLARRRALRSAETVVALHHTFVKQNKELQHLTTLVHIKD